MCNHQPEMFGKLCKSSLGAHTSSDGKKSSPRILEIQNHQEQQIDGSCEAGQQQDNPDDTSHLDVNELKVSYVPTGLVVIFRFISSKKKCLSAFICFESWSF